MGLYVINISQGTPVPRILDVMKLGELVTLRRQFDDAANPREIAVMTANGTRIGSVNRESARWLAERLDSGKPTIARIKRIARGVQVTICTEPVAFPRGEGMLPLLLKRLLPGFARSAACRPA